MALPIEAVTAARNKKLVTLVRIIFVCVTKNTTTSEIASQGICNPNEIKITNMHDTMVRNTWLPRPGYGNKL
ncbi:hypothetical protein TUM12151_30940 [Morganella morganii]|nr:hypothetical protein TUM12149_29490 [Morganella morganii]GIZ32394.1 hypothetical protein TUM12150_28800 [Morganella morganii]GIZ36108.1 hypothetical protein TUM12151_30940 [Morganella morganii]